MMVAQALVMLHWTAAARLLACAALGILQESLYVCAATACLCTVILWHPIFEASTVLALQDWIASTANPGEVIKALQQPALAVMCLRNRQHAALMPIFVSTPRRSTPQPSGAFIQSKRLGLQNLPG